MMAKLFNYNLHFPIVKYFRHYLAGLINNCSSELFLSLYKCTFQLTGESDKN